VPIMTPLMELSPKNLGRKAFRFGIFRSRSPAGKSRYDRCLAMEISRIRGRQYCFVDQALVRLAANGADAKKAFLYYDTNFFE
jgi:hypothetical protein